MTGTQIDVIQGDITRIPADAIVNAANNQLAAGGGVCGAIFRAAGFDDLAQACAAIGQCPTGSAVITPAFAIETARYIIHAVGPVYAQHTPATAEALLESAYAKSLDIAAANGCSSIAFPAISTGIYGYPIGPACEVAVRTCSRKAAETGLAIKLVAFDEATAERLRHKLSDTA